MSRVVLLLPSATYRAPDFLAAARRLEVEVVVASEHRQTLADAMGDRAVVVDLDDPRAATDALVALHGRSPLDGIVAVDDQGVIIAAMAGERLGLPHNPPAAALATRDKATQRQLLSAAGLEQPRFRVCGASDDIAAAADDIGTPVVVKPLSLSGSQGVIRAETPAAAAKTATRVRSIVGDRHAPVLVEQYVPGAEVAVEGLLRAGELEVLAVFDKPDPLVGPAFEETLYVTPSRLPADRLDEITDITARATRALGLREGPIHAELRVPLGEGAPVVLEVASRSIGGLCARALRFGAGISLEEVILRHALRLPLPGLHREAAASGVMMLPIPTAGVLRAVEGQDEARARPGIVGLEITIAPGRAVRPLPEGNRYLGFAFARGASPQEVETALRAAHASLTIRIDGDELGSAPS